MNATIDTVAAPAPVRTPPHATHRFRLLLRREYWEHRGGMLWAPLIAGGLSLLLSVGLLITTIVFARRQVAGGSRIEYEGVTINGLDLGALASQLSGDDLRELADGLYATLLMSAAWPYMVMIFVAFFYCLGALYDDRRDRSVLFWKSLPVSDTATVLSKVVTAAFVIPAISTAIAIVVMLLFLTALSVAAAAHGANPLPLLWGNGMAFLLAAQLVAAIPVYAAWALPTIGWLLLCSAWARSKPFLWAVLLPLAVGAAASMTGLLQLVGLDRHWLWGNVIARLLLGTVPLTGADLSYLQHAAASGDQISNLLSVTGIYANFATPSMWIGIVVGVLMIALAIRLRRWREEG